MDALRMLLVRFVFRDLAKNWIRTGLTIAGIALGVAVMLAINLANGTALSRFRESIDLVAGKSNLEIHAVAGTEIDEQVLARLQWLWDESVKFTPVIDETAVVSGEKPDLVQLLGVDMLADPAFRPFKISSGGNLGETGIFNRDAAYVGSKFAERHHLNIGNTFSVMLNDRSRELRVAGIISYSGPGKAFGGNLIVMDIGSAQEMLGMKGKISRVDVLCPPEKVADVRTRLSSTLRSGIRSRLEASAPRVEGAAPRDQSADPGSAGILPAPSLPHSYAVDLPQRRGQQVQKMIASFQYNLTALSLIALLVGMFLIYNTMSMTVIRKRSEIGMMRALGAGRGMIFALFTVQALIMGALGSLLGLLGGYLFSRSTVKAVGATVQSLYVDQPPADVFVDPSTLLIAFLAGMAISLVAALGPVYEAMSVTPGEATRRASYELRIAGGSRLLAAIGGGLLVIAWLAAQAPAIGGFPVFGYVSAALTIFGVALTMPLVLGFLMAALRNIMRLMFGSEGKLAVLSLNGTLGRTSVTVASLMLGIAMMISLAIMIGSFRETVIVWVNQTLRADLYIAPQTRAASNKGRLSAEVVERIRSTPGVAEVDAFVEMPIEFKGNPTNLGAGDVDVISRRGNLMFVDRRDPHAVLTELNDGSSCIVTESFALRNNVRVGDIIELPAPEHNLRLRVAGVYYDYASDLGYIIIPRQVYSQYYPDGHSTTVAVFGDENADLEQLRQSILVNVGTDTRVNVRSNRELRQEVLRIFDNTFSITYALHAIAILVAILGVMNALFALTYEMRREFAILTYVGASMAQLRKIVLIQAGLLGLLGNLFGLSVGFVLSLLLINVINKQSFGWTVQLSIPIDFILQSSALVLLFALLSGILPAHVAVRNISPEAVRYE